ncbi:MAG: IS3 family transposase [Candidatus Promineifilaceae bacterium]
MVSEVSGRPPDDGQYERRRQCYDSAPGESFFATLKRELVHRRRYRSRDQAKADIIFYIEAFYNRPRRHSALSYLSPVDFEQLHAPLQASALTLCP